MKYVAFALLLVAFVGLTGLAMADEPTAPASAGSAAPAASASPSPATTAPASPTPEASPSPAAH